MYILYIYNIYIYKSVCVYICMYVYIDGLKYWQVGSDDSCETTNRWHPPTCQAAASNIELNAYALLSYITKNDLSSAINVMKWLTAQRNSLGGFASTQVGYFLDATLLAIELLFDL